MPRGLNERWRKWKIKKRRTSYFARGLQGRAPMHRELMRTFDVVKYNAHAMQERHLELCKLFNVPDDMPVPSNAGDPRQEVERTLERLKQPAYRILTFNCFYVEGDSKSDYSARIYFSGDEYYLVEKRANQLRRSICYSSKDRLVARWDNGSIGWATTLIIPSTSPRDGSPSPPSS